MAYKALRSFSGIISMKKGDVRDIKDSEVAKDLLRAGYVMELEESKPVKTSSKKATAKKADVEDGENDG
jgi:hypothetical protein